MRRTRIWALLFLFLVLGLIVSRVTRSGPVRTIRMSMRGYVFNEVNPTITLRAGERVRFVVTNDETNPILHNFRIPGMGVPCAGVLHPGERRDIIVTVPRSGEFTYGCCTHPGMGGKLVVVPR